MTPQVVVPVSDASQVGEARRLAVRLADAAGLSEEQRGATAIVASELATNLYRYGQDGQVLLQVLALPAGPSLEILAVDRGPGMTDVAQCLRDGYSSGGTPGNGLGAVRRMATEFDLHSRTGSGTVVLARIAAARRPAPVAFRWGAVWGAAPGEPVCGDAWRVAERDGEIAVLVADGLGHGAQAATAAERAAAVFAEHAFDGPARFCDRAHRALAGTRGAAIAMAHVAAGRGLVYAGVGNIAGTVADGTDSRGLISQNGTAGFQMRQAQQIDAAWPADARLVMHSDGLTNRWTLASYAGLVRRHPAVIAAVLYRDCRRGRDDATIVVVGAGSTDADV